MFFIAFVLVILKLFKPKTEGQTIHRKPHYKVTKLKFSLNPAQELHFRLDSIYIFIRSSSNCFNFLPNFLIAKDKASVDGGLLVNLRSN